MKAIVVRQFGPPEVLRLEDLPCPEPAAGQVRVRVRATGVNPVETYIRSGAYAGLPSLPYVPGSDAAGEVEKVGPGVSRVAVGARVFVAGSLTGTYAEQAICAQDRVFALPEAISFAQGAAIGVPYATAWRALFTKARAQPGATVLVHGASGAVGLAALQLAAAAGIVAIGTAGSEAGLKLVEAQGARALDHGRADHLERVRELTGGRGVDAVLEMLANVNLGADLGVLAPGATVVVVGSRGPVEINPRELMNREASIVGMKLWNASPAELASIYAGLGAGLSQGTLRPVVARELPLAEAARAHVEILESKAAGKLVLVP